MHLLAVYPRELLLLFDNAADRKAMAAYLPRVDMTGL
jgi:hypothetical protein